MVTRPPNRLLWSRELPQARRGPNPRAVAYVEQNFESARLPAARCGTDSDDLRELSQIVIVRLVGKDAQQKRLKVFSNPRSVYLIERKK